MLLTISRCTGVFLRNTLKPNVLSLTECHSCQEPLMSCPLLPRGARSVADPYSDLAWGANLEPGLELGHHGDSPPRRGSDSPGDWACTSPLASTLPAPDGRPGSNPAVWPRWAACPSRSRGLETRPVRAGSQSPFSFAGYNASENRSRPGEK